jgi:hypothetical protein
MDEQANLYNNIPVVSASEENIIKINTYSVRSTLVFIAFIDFIFELINGFSYALDNNNDTLPLSYSSFICAAIVLVGICGINRYHSCTSKIYGIYVCFKIIGYLAVIFAYQLNFFGLLFFALILMLNVWILKLLYKFTTNLNVLSEEDVESLRSGWKPTIQRIILV